MKQARGTMTRRVFRVFRSRSCSAVIIVSIAATSTARPAVQVPQPSFQEVSAAINVDFEHKNGATPEKHLPETMGGGAVIFDFDNNSWPDVFFVNSGESIEGTRETYERHGLFRNEGDGTYSDYTADSGIIATGYGMGACAADFDNDGWTDLYITNVGANALYRNTGGSRFIDVTRSVGVGSERWSASCTFGDIDNDGDVDLYVANYVKFSIDEEKFCGDHTQGIRTYCHPNVYDPEPDVLYRNDGDGRFTDISHASGIRTAPMSFGLGAVFTDYDDDGQVDLYVANDSVANFLFHNVGDGRFEEVALSAGVAVGAGGQPLAGMGVAAGDINGDGLPELFVTNLDRQMHNLYSNLGGGLFSDITLKSGVGRATLRFVGFGAIFLDFDNDADLDLAVANGDILDNVQYFRDSGSYDQRNLLLQNDGTGRFEDVGLRAGVGFIRPKVSRALAAGDLDNDGDLDLVVANNGQRADVFRNETGNTGNAVLVALEGTESNRDGIGSRVRASIDGRTLYRQVRAGSSYLAQNDSRIHLGLGRAGRVSRLEILWPSGVVDTFEGVAANQIITVREGEGITEQQPLAQRAGP